MCLPRLCKNHEFRGTTTWLNFLGFLCAKDRSVICPRRWLDATRTDVRNSVAAHVHGRTPSSSVDVVVHRACCSASPSYTKRAARDGTPSPGIVRKTSVNRAPEWDGRVLVACGYLSHPRNPSGGHAMLPHLFSSHLVLGLHRGFVTETAYSASTRKHTRPTHGDGLGLRWPLRSVTGSTQTALACASDQMVSA